LKDKGLDHIDFSLAKGQMYRTRDVMKHLITFLGGILENDLNSWDNAAIRANSLDTRLGMQKVDIKPENKTETVILQSDLSTRYRVNTRESDGCTFLHPKAEHTATLIWLQGTPEGPKAIQNLFLDEHGDRRFTLPDGVKIVLPQAPVRAANDSLDCVPSWYNTKN
jgi:hypothetical protein